MPIISVPAPGQLVEVRGRHYVIQDVEVPTLDPDPLRPLSESQGQHLLTLSSIEEDALGEQIEVIWELEPGARSYDRLRLPSPSGFDSPARLDAFVHAVRWGAVSSADIRALQSPFRAGITIEDYQLDPVVRSLQMPRVNLLIADAVGLGKTIEAGLVVQELILRHRARTILVVCPASLQVQWRDQMRDKFGLEFRIIDSEAMRQLRRDRGLHVNPWHHFPRLITSIDYLKRERPLRLFRELLPADGQPKFPRAFDLLIVDEAHNVAPSGSGQYATDSQRTTAIRALVPHFEHHLFLTATPHNGKKESFTALLELIDDQRYARGIPPNQEMLHKVTMVRRLKDELSARWDGAPKFAVRQIQPVEVPYTDEEREIHSLLRRYAELRVKGAASHEENFATEFVLKLLKKRLFSSPEAFRSTLDQHEQSIRSARRRSAQQKVTRRVLLARIEEIGEEYADDDAYESATNEAVESAVQLFHPLSSEEEAVLRSLKEYALRASRQGDSKSAVFVKWLKGKLLDGDGKWTDERVLIFSEYRATQKWLAELLAAHGLSGDDRLMLLYGGMDEEKREAVKAAFQAAPAKSRVRILLATDAASEGIDLQNHCYLLVHYEIPWSPTRMEQRNGRLDRHGQKAPKVLVHHFVGAGYNSSAARDADARVGDLEGDLEFLARMAEKVDQIREDLGKVGPVIAQQVEEAMLGRRRRLETASVEKEAEPVRRMLKFERDLRTEVMRLKERLRESREELDITPENVQSIVKIGLEIAGQPPLVPAHVEGIWPDPTGLRRECPVFTLPPLSGAWAGCFEGLRDPYTEETRPIVFDHDLAAGRQDVVLAHLNHRLVQMCLRLLRAEVWASESRPGKLHRVSARIVRGGALETPAVVAYGRLVVVGQKNDRLHEEVILAGGYLRAGRFARFPSQKEMNAALEASVAVAPSERVTAQLADMWPTIETPLTEALEARAKERNQANARLIEERAARESADLTTILTELSSRIAAELAKHGSDLQLQLFNDEEMDQFEKNQDALRRRLAEIPGELEKEIERLRDRYADPSPRLYPVAVTFLVPERIAREMGA